MFAHRVHDKWGFSGKANVCPTNLHGGFGGEVFSFVVSGLIVLIVLDCFEVQWLPKKILKLPFSVV